MPRTGKAQAPKHQFKVSDEVKIVKDLSTKDSEMVGRIAKILELLPAQGKHPQYKVLIFGENKVRGGIFEVDEREIQQHWPEPVTK